MNEFDEHIELDIQKIKNAIRLQVPIEITSYTLPRNMVMYMHEVLDKFLEECHQVHLKEYLNFCLDELLTNGKKANTKRVYFKEKGLDINDLEDYNKGMETCKEDTISNIDYYLELQKKSGLYVKLSLRLDIDNIVVDIKNNCVLNSFEEERIQQKLDSVQQYKSMEEVFAKVLDTTEGAGLGIIIMVLMLQKVGLSKNNFKIFSTDKETITRITLPCNNETYAHLYDISERFSDLETQIPICKKALSDIQQIVNEKEVDKNKVLSCIRNNSALAMAAINKAIEKNVFEMNIYSVVDNLTQKDLQDIYGEKQNLFRIYPESKEIENAFEHARKVAVYCYNIVKNIEKYNEKHGIETTCDAEQMFAVGLLSSFSLIMLKTSTPEQNKITDEIQDSRLKELFFSGITSGMISLNYAKKMNIPDGYQYQLMGWTCLRLCPQQYVQVMRILYLAETLQYYSEGLLEFYQVDEAVLNDFHICDELQFKAVIESVKKVI